MAFQLNKAFDPLTKMLSGKSGSKTKKTYRYKLTVKGVQISKHYTKKAALAASKKVRGAKVVPLRKTKRY